MAKKPIVSVEIESLRDSQGIVRRPSPEEMNTMLDRMVTDKIEKALAERDLEQLAPVYRNRRIRPIHPGFERDKHALYFEKWGCQTCGRKRNVNHMCNARCERCHVRFEQRMMQLEREWVSKNPESQILEDIDRLTRPLRSARALLGEGG
jgi:hypothetical protein